MLGRPFWTVPAEKISETPHNISQEDRARRDYVPNGLHLVIDFFNLVLDLLFFLTVWCNHPQSFNLSLFPSIEMTKETFMANIVRYKELKQVRQNSFGERRLNKCKVTS